MEIVRSTEEDVNEIVEVLKASLGENDLPLSQEIWNYKHSENPFGASLILLAKEKNKIIGVRAFMRWQWQFGMEMYSAFRAVDTATHPKHRGKGIFKKLTLTAVEVGKKNRDHFVFNTPNEKSRPGYLKMEWKPVGKIKVGLKPCFRSFLKLKKQLPVYRHFLKTPVSELELLCTEWNKRMESSSELFTPKSANYLSWRFENNPLQNYEIYSENGVYMAGYVKKRGNLSELRISECIFDSGRKSCKKNVKRKMREWSAKFGTQVITFSPQHYSDWYSFKGNFGPVLTLRDLNLSSVENTRFLDIKRWGNSLGDLELF